MKPFGKITLINLGILLAYSALLRLIMGGGNGGSLGIAIFSMILIAMHVFANLFLTIYHYAHKESQTGAAFLINIFIIAIVGYGVCYGNASL